MISIVKLNEVLELVKQDLNSQIPDPDNRISSHFLSPTESHFMKKMKDAKGIVLAAKMPDSDTTSDSNTNYNEQNHLLIYILEKTDPGKYTFSGELQRYEYLQQLMREVKKWIISRFSWENDDLGELRLSKDFHTEWEHQMGGCNGLSISFDIEDYEL